MECSAAIAIESQGCTADQPKTGGWVAAALILGMMTSTLPQYKLFSITTSPQLAIAFH